MSLRADGGICFPSARVSGASGMKANIGMSFDDAFFLPSSLLHLKRRRTYKLIITLLWCKRHLSNVAMWARVCVCNVSIALTSIHSVSFTYILRWEKDKKTAENIKKTREYYPKNFQTLLVFFAFHFAQDWRLGLNSVFYFFSVVMEFNSLL